MGPDRLRSLAVVGLVALLLVGAVLSTRGAVYARADFAFCNQQEIASLDPAIATGIPESRILRALYEGLTRYDGETLQARPGIARSWRVSADGLVWRFQLREDSTWTNGDPVTAHDFVWSFRRLLDPGTAAPYAYLAWFFAGGEAYTHAAERGEAPDTAALGVAALSDHELELRLAGPCPFLPRLLAFTPFLPTHRGCLEEHGTDWIRPENIVTNGPFRLVERRIRDRLRLARFDGYWGVDDVALETIDAFSADGVTTQLNMYFTGQVDWMVKPPTGLYDVLLPREDCHVGAQAGTTFFRANLRRPPFDDVRVRQALLLALDREGIARDVMRGGETGSTSFVPEGFPDYTPPPLAAADPQRARRLLAEAGYPDGKGLRTFELLYPHNETTRDFCESVANTWRRELGLDVRLVNQTWKVYLDSQKQGLYDVSWSAWIADYLDTSTFLEIFGSQSSNNRTGWSNARYDELLAASRAQADAGLRAERLAEAEAVLLAELPLLPVYQRVNVNLVSPRVGGFHDNLLDVHPLRDLSVTGPPTPPSMDAP